MAGTLELSKDAAALDLLRQASPVETKPGKRCLLAPLGKFGTKLGKRARVEYVLRDRTQGRRASADSCPFTWPTCREACRVPAPGETVSNAVPPVGLPKTACQCFKRLSAGT